MKNADSGTVERTPRRIILQRTTPQTQPQFYRQETSELNVTYGTTLNVEPSLFRMPSSSALPGELGGQHTVVNFGSQTAPQVPASGPALTTTNTNVSNDDWAVKIDKVRRE